MPVPRSLPGNPILSSVSPVSPVRRRAFARHGWITRLVVHLGVASLPVLGISAQVFGLTSLYQLAIYVMLPLVFLTASLAVFVPDRFDMIVLSGFLWGLLSCAAYDAFRLPTIYVAHLWVDFFGMVGGWAMNGRPNFFVGYLWRYVGDGGGIAVPFFVQVAMLRLCERKNAGFIVMLGIAYAVCPVWLGLVLTDAFAPAGHALFPLTPVTLMLSLAGHLIYGSFLGMGCWHSRRLHQYAPSVFQTSVRTGGLPRLAGAPLAVIAGRADSSIAAARRAMIAYENAGTGFRVSAAAPGQRVLEAVGERRVPAPRPDALRPVVEEYLRKFPDSAFTPYHIGKALARSASGAANALDKLVSLGTAELVSDKPRRYRLAPGAQAPADDPGTGAETAPSIA
jgi:uncharacterized MnhB-related membrane protein